MKTKLIFLILFSYTVLFSQQKIEKNYINYFEDTREVPFLHLNKTSFLKGEEIWFKAYVLEQNSQKLHSTTSNLYVSIFDVNGKMKDQQLIHIKQGLGKGNILLDSTYTEKSYYLKASTKWMKNFNEDTSFLQKVTIIPSTLKQETIITPKKESFEFKLFPEGGHIVANTINNIGILIKDHNNKGIKIKKGVIKDQKNNIIRQFTTNDLGMNSVNLFFKNRQQYTFYATLFNGSEIKAITTNPISEGIVLKVNSKDSKHIVVNISTNSETLKKIAGKEYKVMIHNTRNLNNHSFKFEKNKKKYVLLINKSKLAPSTNIITLFNENNNPVSERIIFNHSDDLFKDINIRYKKIKNDSLEIEFSNISNEKTYASASFLPLNSKAYNPKNNIVSSFLFKPFIKGQIPNISKILSNYNSKNQRKIDLLLLTQGWSKYNWNNIFSKKNNKKHLFENGIDLTTTINKPLKKNQSMVLYSVDNNLVRIINSDKNSWTLKNSFIKKNSKVRFGLKTSKGYLQKFSPSLSYSNSQLHDFFTPTKIEKTNIREFEFSNFKIVKGEFEFLNEVEIKAKKSTDKNFVESALYKKIDLDNLFIEPEETIIDFISFKLPASGYLSRLYLNGKNIIRELWQLDGLYLDQVKSIHYGSDTRSLSTTRGKVFYINTFTPNEYNSKKPSMINTKFSVGFATEKEYYNPKYPSFVNDTYINYGSIFWTPDISIPAYSRVTFKIPKNMQNKINLHIEGISESGKLISKKVMINTNK